MPDEVSRISHTALKNVDGFRAELDGLDLPTLAQILCARRVRLVLRVTSGGDEGYLYFDAGALVHAEARGREGEAAFALMLSWASGETTPCERPWPARPTLQGSIESLLLTAAHMHDETNHPERRDETGVTKSQGGPNRRFEVVPGEGARRSDSPPRGLPLPRDPLPAPRESARAARDGSVRASVRVSTNGKLLAAEGDMDLFAELVAYVTRLGVVLGAELALEPFESLYAEFAGERLVVFLDGGDTVGLLLSAGATAQELRRQLGH